MCIRDSHRRFLPGIDLEFEAPQLFGVTFDADQDAAVLHEGLGYSVVRVAGDQHRDFGSAGEKLELFPRRDVSQQDDEIALALEFRGILARGGERRLATARKYAAELK